LKRIVIFGMGDIAQVVYWYLTKDSPYKIVAFTVHKQFMKNKRLFGLPVVPFEEIEMLYPPDNFGMFVAVGYKKVNRLRKEIYRQAKKKGYKLISYINSKVIQWGEIEIGENCFIFENNVIQPFVKIGNNVIIWSGNHIGHHSSIGDHCFITSHVVISGNVKIEPLCFIGVNATIRDGIKIARESVIGAGAVILHSTKEKGVYKGTPAKLLEINSSQLTNL